jgi:ribosomal protein S25
MRKKLSEKFKETYTREIMSKLPPIGSLNDWITDKEVADRMGFFPGVARALLLELLKQGVLECRSIGGVRFYTRRGRPTSSKQA